MDRGRLVLAPFTYSDLRGLKRRPACVVSSPAYNQGPDVIIAMVTSSRGRLAGPGLGDVVVQDWQAAGLPLPSVVRAGRLLVVESRLLTGILGDLSVGDLAAVDQALGTVLGQETAGVDRDVDLVADLNALDDAGLGWSRVADADDPDRVRPGALLLAGNRQGRAVVCVVAVDPDGQVHFTILPGSVARNQHLLNRT